MADPRVFLVTGCSSGIGRALARELRERGQRCIPTARREASLQELRNEGFEPLMLDVTDEGSIRGAVRDAIAREGRIDAVVNNAGTSLFGPLAETPLEDVRRMYETNVTGPLAVTQAVFAHMAGRGSGLVVNVGSMVGVVPTPWVGAYCGAKAAVHTWSDVLRAEVAPFGIDVMVVQPGGVRSDVADKAPVHADTPHYAPVRGHIERRSRASQSRPMEADAFARRVVDAMLARRPRHTVRVGAGVGLLNVLERLPRRWVLGLLSRGFGVTELRRP